MSRQIAEKSLQHIILRLLLQTFVSYTVRTDRQTDKKTNRRKPVLKHFLWKEAELNFS
jgi:hypothetical protein